MHLQRLEAAGLIVGSLELSEDGKAMKYYEVVDFNLHLTASTLAAAARTLTPSDPQRVPRPRSGPDVPQRGPDEPARHHPNRN
jgi:ArsR family transcriptional regulator